MIKLKLNIWQKFFLGFIVIILVIVLITGYMAIRSFNTEVEQKAELTLNKDLNAFSRMFYRRVEHNFFYLKFIADNPEFFELINENDTTTLRQRLIEFKEKKGLHFVSIIKESGQIVASANSEFPASYNFKNDFIAASLQGESLKGVIVLEEEYLAQEGLLEQVSIQVVNTPEAMLDNRIGEEKRGLAIAGSVPILNGENEVVAVLFGGELLNRDYNFIDEISELLKVKSTIFLGDLRIATSIFLKNGERAIGTRVAEEVASIVLEQGKRYLGKAFIIDEWYLTAYDPIFDHKGEVVGMLFVGIPEAPFVQTKKDTVNTFLLIAFFSLLLAVVIAYFLAQTIKKPLQKLVTTMQRVESGDLTQRYLAYNHVKANENNKTISSSTSLSLAKKRIKKKEPAGDEIQHLGNIFNNMMESLQTNWKKNQELQEKLEEKEKMRLHLLKKIIVTQEEERKRISRELHDETSQSLTSLLLGLKLIQEADDINEVHTLAGGLREIISKTLEEIQWLSYELRPSVLDDLGLHAALNRYVNELSQHAGIKIDYDLQACKDLDTRLGSVVETTIYRVVQEALTNVIRHAEAQNVKVSLRCDEKNIEAIIEDDGKGFDFSLLQNDQQALGLFGMTERASLVGGELVIDTAPGKGTRVILRIPLEEIAELNN